MAELRWNPLIKDWVMIASHRQNRPQMPKDWCPFCPGSGKVPDHFTVIMISLHFHKIRLYRMMLKQEFTRQSRHTASAKLFCTHRSIL